MNQYDIQSFLKIMEKLRSPGGCPWDKKQNFESLLPYLIEESSEYIDAVYKKDFGNMKEELGDVLLQVVFHAQLAKEEKLFDFADVVESIASKMVRRHPHVFGNENIEDSGGVLERWQKIKAEEKQGEVKENISILEGVSMALPALDRAQQIQKKVEKVGFDWKDIKSVIPKVEEELEECRVEVEKGDMVALEDEIGDLLFSVVCMARKAGINSEQALRKANLKFSNRFQMMESLATFEELEKMTSDEMESLWQEVKIKLEEKKGA
jgi:tetrapyrrole methylase family protein / MazG family protein